MPFGACHSVGMLHALPLAWHGGLKTGKTWSGGHACMCARGIPLHHPPSHMRWIMECFGCVSVGALSSEHRGRARHTTMGPGGRQSGFYHAQVSQYSIRGSTTPYLVLKIFSTGDLLSGAITCVCMLHWSIFGHSFWRAGRLRHTGGVKYKGCSTGQ